MNEEMQLVFGIMSGRVYWNRLYDWPLLIVLFWKFGGMTGLPGSKLGECKGQAGALCGGQSWGDVALWQQCQKLFTVRSTAGHAWWLLVSKSTPCFLFLVSFCFLPQVFLCCPFQVFSCTTCLLLNSKLASLEIPFYVSNMLYIWVLIWCIR